MNLSNLHKLRWGLAAAILAIAAVSTAHAAEPGSGDDVQVFDESTSFEHLLSQRKDLERNPASIDPVARVIGVRRELALTSSEADRTPQDIILNAGTGVGITEGLELALVRKVPVIDPYRENQQSELEVEFGKIKIIHAQKDISVARLEMLDAVTSGMFVGTRAPMVGDFVTRSK